MKEVCTPAQAIQRLQEGNAQYLKAVHNNADISIHVREHTAKNGQTPFAVIVTCSDSRVPPEHIFSAGVGELFVIRTAGNVIGQFELGSVEYGAEHLGAKIIVILGHTQCGAVAAALKGHGQGNIDSIIKEIQGCIGDCAQAGEAEDINIRNSAQKIRESAMISDLIARGQVQIAQAKYDINTGKVEFF